MGLTFPNQPEVLLGKSPLREVICQVRFPPILKIGIDNPTDFQDKIRKRFPGFEKDQQVLVHIGTSPATDNPVPEQAPYIYRFKSQDGKASVALTTNFFALSTNAYTHWSSFVDDFQFAEQIVRDQYQPSTATRVGLRFINRLTLKNTGCKTFNKMLGLLRKELTCLVRTDAWRDPIDMLTQIVIPDEGGKLVLRFGLGCDEDEKFFLLDFDYFEDTGMEFWDISKRIELYHDRIYQAFRWCLTKEAIDCFKPIVGK